MKKVFFLFLATLLITAAKAQTIDFIDPDFEHVLVTSNALGGITYNSSGAHMDPDTNNDGHIQVSEAHAVYGIILTSNFDVTNFGGIEFFTSLKTLSCNYTGATTINMTTLTNLENLKASYGFTSLDLHGLTHLKTIEIIQNPLLTTLNLTGLNALTTVNISHNTLLGSLDLSGKPLLTTVDASYNGISSVNCTGATSLHVLNLLNNNLSTIDLSSTQASLNNVNLRANHLTALNVTGFTALTSLDCAGNQLTNLAINTLANLQYLYCSGNQITALDPQGLVHLIELDCDHNQISQLNVQGIPTLFNLDCSDNLLTTLDVHALTPLKFLYCYNNQLTSLNVAGLPHLEYLHCYNNAIPELDLTDETALAYLFCYNNQLTVIHAETTDIVILKCESNHLIGLYIKNGNSETLTFNDNPNLVTICADDFQIDTINTLLTQYGMTNVDVNTYCTDDSGISSNSVIASLKYYQNTNMTGTSIDLSNVLVYDQYTQAGTLAYYTDALGQVTVRKYGQGGGMFYVGYAELENSGLFTGGSALYSFDFDCCVPTNSVMRIAPIASNLYQTDFETVLIPLTEAKPGFDIKYKLICRNKGNYPRAGSVNLNFDDAVLDVVAATPAITSQTTNILNWNIATLKPFETKEFLLTMHLNSPTQTPPVTLGYVLNYNATVNVISGIDYTPADNTFAYHQTVVNAFDPNNKICLEGPVIGVGEVGKYVHYVIHFENNGSANAQRVIIADKIDLSKFDIKSLVILNNSHPVSTKIIGNKVEFTFDTINLPFDDANNDGYIVFKIKTKPTLVAGDTFSNTASIYFDYNFPIVTDPAVTTVALLANQDFEFERYFKIYPNPVHDVLNIETIKTIEMTSINVYNILGQLILVIPNAQQTKSIDVSTLKAGNYFIKINADQGTSSLKLIKK